MSDWKVEKRIDLSMILSALIVVAGIFSWGISVITTQAEVNQKLLSVEKDIQETRTYLFKVEERLQKQHQ